MKKNIINIKSLQKTYKDCDEVFTVLDGVNMELNEGDFCAITGQSGSGKTTLLQIISLMQQKTGGLYLFNGIDIDTMTQKQKYNMLQKDIAIVYQQHNMLKDFSVYENILLSTRQIELSIKDVEFIDFVLDSFGIYSKKNSRLDAISGGQAQRASIARAICKKPKLLLMDEPTGNLDEETSQTVMQTVNTVCSKLGISYILITHNTSLTKYTNKQFVIAKKNLHLL